LPIRQAEQRDRMSATRVHGERSAEEKGLIVRMRGNSENSNHGRMVFGNSFD
jgi:hypothetical protein